MIEIIPAIDIIDGKCVRLTKGNYAAKTVYDDDPLEVAKKLYDTGCRRLHLVDLDGAKSRHIVNHKTLERIATKTNFIIDFGGGLKSNDDLHIAFECGASMVTGGSIAVQKPELFIEWLNHYGADKIILGADTRNGKIATSGWVNDSDNDIIPFIHDYVEKGITQVISTDIDVDGTLTGPSVNLYKTIMDKIPKVSVIASGGVSSIADIELLDNINIPAVIVGKAIYEGTISLKEIQLTNLNR